ncbi:alanine racemase [Streptomyces sp. UNOC14_S4]|uniref:alanine racemase n=1 Tax=Streptomyces sp. UNOC14_S4 TaxID=2872340 RepID=UPI001E395DA8|nr:alanine racemase [Streptomyces sp. UNOC14_S4]MCC3768933.1 alanine racemase [Streptomyces sp. UNOC14_S4]
MAGQGGQGHTAVPWPAQQWSTAAERPALPVSALPEPVVDRLYALARASGDEPLSAFVYEPRRAARAAAELRAALPEWAEVCYAVKANAFPAVLGALAPAVDGFDVSSLGELRAVRAACPAPGAVRTIATGPGKTDRMLDELLRSGVESDVSFVSVESGLELRRVAGAAARAGRAVPVVVRVNPGGRRLDGALRMAGRATQFGVPEDALGDVLATARALPSVTPVGLHFHVVSNNLDAAGHAAYVRSCLELSARTARRHGIGLEVVDVGGGIGGTPFDLRHFGGLLAATAPPDGTRVVFEPGRRLVADCGWFAAEVTDVKEAGGTAFAVLGGGINHFMLPALLEVALDAVVLPVEEWPYDCPRPEVRDTALSLAGPLCTPEDILARGIRVPRLRAGDVVVFPLAGAYGWEFSVSGFLSRGVAVRTTTVP